MQPKNKTFSFTWAMIIFYLLSTSLFNWFNGTALKSLGFYIPVLFLDFLSFIWIIKIINTPHYVRNKKLTASTVLMTLGLLSVLMLLTSSYDVETTLSNIYLIVFFLSMAGLIAYYKKTGIVKPCIPVNDPIIIDQTDNKIINQPERPLSNIFSLKNNLDKAILITKEETIEYNDLKKAQQLTSAIIDQKIKVPEEVVSQINNIIGSYIYLTTLPFKDEKTESTLAIVVKTFPDINEGLTNIYDQGINSSLEKIEIDAQTLKRLLDLSGFNNSDFEVNSVEENYDQN